MGLDKRPLGTSLRSMFNFIPAAATYTGSHPTTGAVIVALVFLALVFVGPAFFTGRNR